MTTYYNEFDPNAAAWLRQLIKMNLIANGIVDERSIIEVQPQDLAGFKQCHFFAGIGGWSLALRLAGIADHCPVWTASLPCQPFSVAGKQLGKSDERHLLPHFLKLFRACKPNVIYGEQVPGAIKHGWLDDLCDEMGAEGYTVRADVRTAAGAGSFHIRQRLYWMANSESARINRERISSIGTAREIAASRRQQNGELVRFESRSAVSGMANIGSERLQGHGGFEQEPIQGRREGTKRHDSESGTVSGMGDTEHNGHVTEQITASNVQPSEERRQDFSSESTGTGRSSDVSSLSGCEKGRGEWHDPDWIYCRDNKYRPIKPGLKPLVDGISKGVVRSGDISAPINADETQEARVMRLKGYGNAIVPQVAAQFIMEYME